MKAEIRLMKEELSAIERYRTPKEKSLAQCTSSLEAMRATKDGLESELHQELMAQLSVADQHQVSVNIFLIAVEFKLNLSISYFFFLFSTLN